MLRELATFKPILVEAQGRARQLPVDKPARFTKLAQTLGAGFRIETTKVETLFDVLAQALQGAGAGAGRGRRRDLPRARAVTRLVDGHGRRVPWLPSWATSSTAEFLVAFTIATTAGILVFLHADRNGSKHTTAWGICVFLFLVSRCPST